MSYILVTNLFHYSFVTRRFTSYTNFIKILETRVHILVVEVKYQVIIHYDGTIRIYTILLRKLKDYGQRESHHKRPHTKDPVDVVLTNPSRTTQSQSSRPRSRSSRPRNRDVPGLDQDLPDNQIQYRNIRVFKSHKYMSDILLHKDQSTRNQRIQSGLERSTISHVVNITVNQHFLEFRRPDNEV